MSPAPSRRSLLGRVRRRALAGRRARFESHIQTCEPCADAYEEFKAGIAALRELPQARMPHAVHLPSTAPVAERPPRPTIGLSWFNLGLLRRFPATAIAGAAAVVIVIFALAHGSARPQHRARLAGQRRQAMPRSPPATGEAPATPRARSPLPSQVPRRPPTSRGDAGGRPRGAGRSTSCSQRQARSSPPARPSISTRNSRSSTSSLLAPGH